MNDIKKTVSTLKFFSGLPSGDKRYGLKGHSHSQQFSCVALYDYCVFLKEEKKVKNKIIKKS
jgi:hypothetical protein